MGNILYATNTLSLVLLLGSSVAYTCIPDVQGENIKGSTANWATTV